MGNGVLKADTNLREGPGTGYKNRGLVGRMRGVEILDRTSYKEWAQVRVIDGDSAGKVGWMHKDNLNMDKSTK